MKKCLLGIGILLFAILLTICSTGLGFTCLIIGIIGLFILILGTLSKNN